MFTFMFVSVLTNPPSTPYIGFIMAYFYNYLFVKFRYDVKKPCDNCGVNQVSQVFHSPYTCPEHLSWWIPVGMNNTCGWVMRVSDCFLFRKFKVLTLTTSKLLMLEVILNNANILVIHRYFNRQITG